MTYIKTLKGGKSQIMKDVALSHILNNSIPNENQSISELLKFLDKEIKLLDPSVTGSALNNAHGDWYEWLLAIAAWNFCAENKNANLALLTPNITQITIATLYKQKLYDLIDDLKKKVHLASEVQLISSNPDFVIIDRSLVDKILPELKAIKTIDLTTIHDIDNVYQKFVGQCDFNDIIGYVSVKSSLRPDRRLQIPHEGSLMKALYTHLQTREWILNPKGIKYYAISTRITDADRLALKTVATHSITTVQSIPQAAVDNVFEVDTMQQAQLAFQQILNS